MSHEEVINDDDIHPNKLHKHFPEVKHVLDADKVKSIKLSQGFKKVYNVFLACKDPSEFSLTLCYGWDKISCKVTASNAIWEKF
ncbi:uncharacterized protein VP01_2743g2 [Puccinia sorghi]|uniref:Uncharacterized protein n=1 Tax=Puccinia sorghi TaxID=27349 RepID=A0A0L6V363_9BASI|nr:uncharacterized protein VP01_2743g2 [Puccinia sorghi]